ncbi:MAG: regulator [Pseudomonadota bacterium]
MTTQFAFDESNVSWHPFAGLDHLEFTLCNLDEERQIADLLVKFEPSEKVAIHNHLAKTNMLIIQGELRMYHTNGDIKEIRKPGEYFEGRTDDCHSEGGGPDGAVVYYSIRGHGEEDLVELMDDEQNVVARVGMPELRAMWAEQHA